MSEKFTKKNTKKRLLSMSEAAAMTPYAQDYLSLLCRRGQMQGEKIGRKWYTTVEWINDYLKEMKPEAVIEVKSEKLKVKSLNSNADGRFGRNKIFENGLILKPLVFWLLSVAGLVILIVGIYSIINGKVEKIQAGGTQFVPEQIIKVPNEEGGFDVYGEGRMKIGEEDNANQNSLYLNP